MTTVKIPEQFRALADQAREQGWTIELSNAHLRWTGPDGQVVTSSQTPSDRRAATQLAGDLRTAGLTVNGRVTSRRAETEAPAGAGPTVPETTVPVPAAPQDELRALVTAAREAARDLKREVQAARELIDGGAADHRPRRALQEGTRRPDGAALRGERGHDGGPAQGRPADQRTVLRPSGRGHELCTNLIRLRDAQREALIPAAFRASRDRSASR